MLDEELPWRLFLWSVDHSGATEFLELENPGFQLIPDHALLLDNGVLLCSCSEGLFAWNSQGTHIGAFSAQEPSEISGLLDLPCGPISWSGGLLLAWSAEDMQWRHRLGGVSTAAREQIEAFSNGLPETSLRTIWSKGVLGSAGLGALGRELGMSRERIRQLKGRLITAAESQLACSREDRRRARCRQARRPMSRTRSHTWVSIRSALGYDKPRNPEVAGSRPADAPARQGATWGGPCTRCTWSGRRWSTRARRRGR